MFVARREDGSIYGTWSCKQWPDQEWLPEDNAELIAFLSKA